MQQKRPHVGLTIDPDVDEKLREVAHRERRSLSFCVNEALREWLNLPDIAPHELERRILRGKRRVA